MATTISPLTEALETLSLQTRGDVIRPGDDRYESARRVYNGMIDRKPAAILRCRDAADVIAGVAFAGENGFDLSIRGGGHSVAGFGTSDGGVVLDLSQMHDVHIDPTREVAWVSGGATWGDVDHTAWALGLATPGGVISTTGVAGLGLGGGFGHLTRGFGLVVDNMLAIDVVTADGHLVRASEEENPDLFWALRGGGGNFGVVTRVALRLHQLPAFYGGPIFYLASESERVLRFYRDFIEAAPRELSAFFSLQLAPPAPFIPESLHLKPTCAITVAYGGPEAAAAAAVRPVRDAAPVAVDLAGPIPYPALNSMFDAAYPPGLQHYWKADFVDELTDTAIAIHAERGSGVPSPLSMMHLYPLNGAVHDVAPEATAFRHRSARFTHVIGAIAPEATHMPEYQEWVRDYWSALHAQSAKAGYVNFLMDEGEGRIRAAYGHNYDRLAEVKAKWDPTNLFHLNQNIAPVR